MAEQQNSKGSRPAANLDNSGVLQCGRVAQVAVLLGCNLAQHAAQHLAGSRLQSQQGLGFRV